MGTARLVRSFAWRGGNGSLAVAADWTGGGAGAGVPSAADNAAIAGATPGLIFTTGALSVAALTVTGGVAVAGQIVAGTLTVAGTLVLQAGATLQSSGATLSNGSISASGAGAVFSVHGALALAGDAAVIGGAHLGATSVTLDGGTLEQDALSGIVVGGGAAVAGTLAVAAGGSLAGSGKISAAAGAVIVDDGSITAAGGVLSVFGAISGAGTLAIGAAATLFVAGGADSGLSAAFTGAGGTLELFTEAAAFAATIDGFAQGEAIDIASATIVGAVWSAGTLTLTASDGGTLALALPDPGTAGYAGDVFVPVPDGLGGTLVTIASSPTVPPLTGIITLDPASGTIGLVGGPSGHATRLTVGGVVAIDARFTTQTLTLAGTLVVPQAASFLATNANEGVGAAMLLAEGTSTLSVHATLALGGALVLLGGAIGSVGTILLQGGAITLDAASSLAVGGAAPETGTLAIAATSTLAGYGRIAAAVDVSGLLRAQGGALTLTGAVSGSGALAVGAGATLAAFGPTSANVTLAAGTTLDLFGTQGGFTGTLSGFAAGDVLDIGFATLDGLAWSPGTLALLDGGATVDTVAIAGDYTGQAWQVTPDGSGGAVVTLAGSSAAGPLDITGTLDVPDTIAAVTATADGAGFVAMQGGVLAVGALSLAPGATLDGFGAVQASVDVSGALAADGGVLSVSGPISGSGTVRIGADATLYAPLGIATATSVVFAGAGATLELFQSPALLGATLGGFVLGDAIDIAGDAVLSATWTASGGLALADASGDLGAIALSGDFTGWNFFTRPDGDGGTLIALIPCLAAGTRVATPYGEVPVERLGVGDAVVTPEGPRRLRWVACRRCDTAAAPELRAVRIAAGALGGGRPSRDLRVSPRHALLLEGVLVPAVALVNGGGVTRAPGEVLTYHHLAFDTHATILAEGMPVETFQPQVAAALFDAEQGRRPLPGPACAPRLEGGAALEALRARLFGAPVAPAACGQMRGFLERATELDGVTYVEGWAFDPARPDHPVALTLLRDGVACGEAVANHWRPDLDRAGLAFGRCAFRMEVPGKAAGFTAIRAGGGGRLPHIAAQAADSHRFLTQKCIQNS